MGVEYGLFDKTNKEWLDLGKDLSNRGDGYLFQTKSEEIVKFLCERKSSKFEIIGDNFNRPSDNDCDDKYNQIKIIPNLTQIPKTGK